MSFVRLIIDIILKNQYILDRNGVPYYEFNYVLNSNQKTLLSRIFSLALAINYQHYDKVSTLQKNIKNIKDENLEPLMTSLYEQLTADSKSWYRILLFFNIIAEFRYSLYISQDYLIEVVSKFTKEKIQPWIDEQNGWESVHIDRDIIEFPEIDVSHAFLRRSKRLAAKRLMIKQVPI